MTPDDQTIATAPGSNVPNDLHCSAVMVLSSPQLVKMVPSNYYAIEERQSLHPRSSQRLDRVTLGGSGEAAGVLSEAPIPTTLIGPHQASIPNNQRGVQFDVLTDLVRASRPHFIWHLNKACSRAATHILAEQTPGFTQSACHAALALAVATKARVAPLKRASANLDTERLLIVSRYHAPGYMEDYRRLVKSNGQKQDTTVSAAHAYPNDAA